MEGFPSPRGGVPDAQRVMPSASRNSSPCRVFDEENASRGAQSAFPSRGDLSLRRGRMGRILAREKEKEAVRTSSKPGGI